MSKKNIKIHKGSRNDLNYKSDVDKRWEAQ